MVKVSSRLGNVYIYILFTVKGMIANKTNIHFSDQYGKRTLLFYHSETVCGPTRNQRSLTKSNITEDIFDSNI